MRFDHAATFGEDYLHFYGAYFTADIDDADAAAVVSFLDLAPGDRVLDAPCGYGRIANRLAAGGMHVVGVDRSRRFLDVAEAAGAGVRYVEGDLLALPVDGPFDAVVCWFTSFGYFDDDGNRTQLAEYRRVLRPGGRLVVEMHNRDEFVRRFSPAPYGNVVQVGDDVLVDTTTFDCVQGSIETDRLVVRGGEVRRTHHSIRLPSITELGEWLRGAGFTDVSFRARDGEPPSIHRPRLVVVATA